MEKTTDYAGRRTNRGRIKRGRQYHTNALRSGSSYLPESHDQSFKKRLRPEHFVANGTRQEPAHLNLEKLICILHLRDGRKSFPEKLSSISSHFVFRVKSRVANPFLAESASSNQFKKENDESNGRRQEQGPSCR